MDLETLPEELQGLTLMEQTLISPVKPFLTVFRLEGGQYGYNGQIINFNQDISALVTELPNAINSISNTVIFRRETDDLNTFFEVRVHKMKVWEALSWLIKNNPVYRKKITINQQNLNELPDDGSIHDQLPKVLISPENKQFVEYSRK